MTRTLAAAIAALVASACGPVAPTEQLAQFTGVCGLLISADANAPIQDLNTLLTSHNAKFCRWALGRREMLAFRTPHIKVNSPEPDICELSELEDPSKIRFTAFKDLRDFSTACFEHGIQISHPELFTLKDRLPSMPQRCFAWSRVEKRSPLLSEPNPVWLVNQLYQEYTLPVFASHVDEDHISFWLDVPSETSAETVAQHMTLAAEREGLVLTPAECAKAKP